MDDNARNAASYQVDQEILDARGIKMTVEEVAGLSTCKYSEKVHSLKLNNQDLAFLKGLRRRIKNRLASQNSRRRSVEHLRKLTRELRAVRACRRDALVERRVLLMARERVRDRCVSLRAHLVKVLDQRSDTTEVPKIDIPESQPLNIPSIPIPKPKHTSVIVTNGKDREKLQKELDKEDVYERVRRELQSDKKEKIIIKQERVFEGNTIIIKEEVPDYDDITIEDDFELKMRNMDTYNKIAQVYDQRIPEDSSCQSLDGSQKSYDGHSVDCGRSFADDGGSFADDGRSFADDGRSFAYDGRSFADDGRSFADDGRNFADDGRSFADIGSELSKDIFECNIGKLVQKSVNHIFNDKKKVFAKTVFIANEKLTSNIKTVVLEGQESNSNFNGALNLSVKEGRRKSHGRKQSAPRRIACYDEYDDAVLDLKVKKEPQ